MTSLRRLATERPNPRTQNLDRLSTRGMLARINAEDLRVPLVVRRCIPRLAQVVEAVSERLQRGGRLLYVGAGTSGRLGCLDASEMPPTFGVPPRLVQGLMAGGSRALTRSLEGAEDDGCAGARVIRARGVGPLDAVVGLSASGRARFVREALKEARRRGAFTAAITCNVNSALAPCAHVAVVAETGPEVLAGSTRMKAGTAQKLILNMLSTAVMVRLGRVQGNRMVDLQLKCEKLVERAQHLVMDRTGAGPRAAARALRAAKGSVRQAIAALRSTH